MSALETLTGSLRLVKGGCSCSFARTAAAHCNSKECKNPLIIAGGRLLAGSVVPYELPSGAVAAEQSPLSTVWTATWQVLGIEVHCAWSGEIAFPLEWHLTTPLEPACRLPKRVFCWPAAQTVHAASFVLAGFHLMTVKLLYRCHLNGSRLPAACRASSCARSPVDPLCKFASAAFLLLPCCVALAAGYCTRWFAHVCAW